MSEFADVTRRMETGDNLDFFYYFLPDRDSADVMYMALG